MHARVKLSVEKDEALTLHLVSPFLRLWRNAHWQNYASFHSLLSRAGLGNRQQYGQLPDTDLTMILGKYIRQLKKEWIIRDATNKIEDCLTGLTGSST